MTTEPGSANARSFGSVADEYVRGRPGYPDQTVRWLLDGAEGVVVDVGAGTGKLTASLAAYAPRVLAVEPLLPMVARLQRAVPSAVACAGSAERLPLRDGTAAAVVVGQAFHWFDPSQALAEFGRVLVAGGRLGLLWNIRDATVPWVAAVSEVIGSESSDELDPWREGTGPFVEPEYEVFAHEQVLDRVTLLDLVASRSYAAVLPPAEREALLAAVDSVVRTHPDLAGRDTFALPYVTHAFRARAARPPARG